MHSRRVLSEINSVQKQLSDSQSKLSEHPDLKASLAEALTDLQKILAGSAASSGAIGLQTASSGLSSALRVVESSDRAVPAQALELYQASTTAVKLRIGEWDQFKTKRLTQLNKQLQEANIAPIAIRESGHTTP